MRKKGYWSLILSLVMALVACDQKHDHKGKTPLVEVAGKFLYKEDLQTVLPLNLELGGRYSVVRQGRRQYPR